MKKFSLIGIAAVTLSAVARAQPATATVQVTVLGAVQMTASGTTDFGPVGTQVGTKTINPNTPVGAQQTAAFTANGTANATIVVQFDASLDLCHQTAGCGTKIVFTPNLSACGCNNQPSSSLIPSGGAAVLNGGGQHFFWLGGSINVQSNPIPGLYSGTFTLSASYQ